VAWLAPLASAGLLYLSFFPVGCGWLAWVALVPWLYLVRSPARPRRLYFAAWLGGLAFFVPVLQWMRVADPRMYLTWAVLSAYCALYASLTLYFVRRLDRNTSLPLVLTFPTVLVGLEYWRYGFLGSFASLLGGSHDHDYPGGFGWYLLGHSQHDFLELIQIADLAGVYGVSFLVAAVNALLFEMLYARPWFREAFIGPGAEPHQGKGPLLLQGLAVAALLLAALGYGVWRLGERPTTPGPRLALLQGNVPQSVRISTGEDGEEADRARLKMANHFSDLAALAVKQKVDLVVWPETSYPGTWKEIRPGRPLPEARDLAARMAGRWKTPQLVGVNAVVMGHDGVIRSYNSAVLLDKQGRWQGRYDKVHRVPFGEYVPFRKAMPWLNKLAPYDYDYSVSPGREFTRFTLPDRKGPAGAFGVVICYEDTDPAMARPYVREGNPVGFLLNISNDGWFDGTSEHDQHLAICRFRAVECRRAVARAVNMGISAVIDGNGRVLAPTTTRKDDFLLWEVPDAGGGAVTELPVARWHEFKKTAGVLAATIPIDSRESLYARWGDVFAALCLGVLPLSLVVIRLRKRRGGPS
jgi:apolipoprotein N-acyltransferase